MFFCIWTMLFSQPHFLFLIREHPTDAQAMHVYSCPPHALRLVCLPDFSLAPLCLCLIPQPSLNCNICQIHSGLETIQSLATKATESREAIKCGRKVKTEGIPELITGSGKVYHRLIWPQVWLEKYPRKVPMRAEKLSCVSLVNL